MITQVVAVAQAKGIEKKKSNFRNANEDIYKTQNNWHQDTQDPCVERIREQKTLHIYIKKL